MNPLLPSLAPLDDQELLAELPRLARSERSATVALVARLAELDARHLYLAAGFSSLFAYCTTALRLSENEAYYRIHAARAVRRFPELLDRLGDGSLSLTTLRLVAPHLDDDKQLLEAAAGKSKRQVEELVVARHPEAPVVSSVRKLPALAEPTASLSTSRRPLVALVSADQFRITITASHEMKDELSRVQDLLRHQIPDGDPGQILAHVTFPPRSGAWSGNGTEGAVRSWPRTDGAAPNAEAWSSITSIPTRSEARRRLGTSPSAAGGTTSTRP